MNCLKSGETKKPQDVAVLRTGPRSGLPWSSTGQRQEGVVHRASCVVWLWPSPSASRPGGAVLLSSCHVMLRPSLAPPVPVQAHVGPPGIALTLSYHVTSCIPQAYAVSGQTGGKRPHHKPVSVLRRVCDTGGTTVQAARTLSMTQESESIDYI